MKYIRWYWKNIKDVWWMLALAIVLQIMIVLCSIGMVIVSKGLIDCVTIGFDHTFLGDRCGKDTLKVLAVITFVIIGVKLASNAGRSWLQTKSNLVMNKNVKLREFSNILHVESDVRSRFHSGDLMNRINNEINHLTSCACSSIPNIIGNTLQFLFAFGYMLYLQPVLAWILVVIIPVGIVGGKFIILKIRNLTKNVREDESRVYSHLQESIQNLQNIKTMEYEGHSWNKSGNLLGAYVTDSMKRLKFSISANLVVNATFSISYALVFLWGAVGILHGTITFGVMTAFLQIIGQITGPLLSLSSDLPGLLYSTASIDRLADIENLPVEIKGKKYVKEGEVAGVRIDNISFAYTKETGNVFDGFSWEFKPGSRTSIIGETGVGKSTLVKLLLALERPQKGSMVIYSKSSEFEVSPESRCNIAYVPQGNSLFSGTVRDNLMMGKPDATEEELRHVLHVAVADFVDGLPYGMDTQCFETGGGLSEGQAQRIAVARGLLRPGSILVMDEFSSALDPNTETVLMERLSKEFPDKTMIFITHRSKVSEYCDSVLDLETEKNSYLCAKFPQEN